MKKNKLRENWTGRLGFILATAGFAIGLGNIWRFSYVAGNNGGGAFLIIYLAIMALFGIPLFLAEAGLGRKAGSGIIVGMRKLTKKGSPWVIIGWLGTLAAALIISYYFMIMGWMLDYFVKIASGTFSGKSTAEISAVFDKMVTSPWEVIIYSLIAALMIGYIVSRGITGGIERFSRLVMPTLVILLTVLAIFSLTLPGALEGAIWYLKPDFSQVGFGTVLEALGQAFFSVGIGLAAAFTYGSYLKREESNLVTDGIWVISLDTFIAFISGLVIFPALFAFDVAPDSGAGLLFLTIPNLFDMIPGGTFFGLLFFFLVIIAGLTTGVGLVEAVVVNIAEVFKLKRRTSIYVSTIVLFLLSIPSILSQGPWSEFLIFGMDIFDFVDYVSGNILLTLGGLLIALYVAFKWKFENFMNELNVGTSGVRITPILKPLITVFIPVVIAFIVLSSFL